MQSVTNTAPRPRVLEFGIYRDGDNNLDKNQSTVLDQAAQTSARDGSIGFDVMNETSDGGALHTESYEIADGVESHTRETATQDMADPKTLAQFVAHTLDQAERNGSKQTWIDLVDHGGGDGGGLEADSTGHIMSMPGIARAIADGIAMHAQEHPEDAGRGVDGVVANQCLMSTMGFADALSRDGVKWLAASPETMISPGAPTTVAHAIAQHLDDPDAMANAVVKDVMQTTYGIDGFRFGGAAAFDVLDLGADKIGKAESAIKQLNDQIASEAKDRDVRSSVRGDAQSVEGMVRFPGSKGLPWHADRPAIALYNTLAADTSLSSAIRSDANAASKAVGDLVLAHDESAGFAPFGGSDYRDAVGPTVHAPVTAKQIDPWAPHVSETDNAFYHKTDQDKLVGVLA